MGITSAGIGSNLDIEGIISKLMSIEQQPLAKMARTEASYQSKLSGIGLLKGAMSAFQTAVKGLADASKFQPVKASVTDATIATASGAASAKPGTYALKVAQLAQAQKLAANGVASESAPVGKGVITIDFGTISDDAVFNAATSKYTTAKFTSAGAATKPITIDDSNNSLQGIRDAINKAGIGVTANIVNDGSGTPYRLTLTNDKTGAATAMKISVADADGNTGLGALLNHDPSGTQGFIQTSTARDAKFSVDGIDVTKPTNSPSDVIQGVTLNLLKESTTATNVTITRDTAVVKESINSFVKAYNEINNNMRDSMAYNATTKTAAVLNGESSVRNMQSQVRSILATPVAGGATVLSTLARAGITTQKDGTLLVDNTKLDKAIAENFDDLGGLFAAVGKSTDATVSYTGVSSATAPGSYAVFVSRAATQGSTTATMAAGPKVDATNDKFEVTLNGVTATITLAQKDYTPAELAVEVQSKINSAGPISAAGGSVLVTETNGILKVTSSRFGADSTVTIKELGTAVLNFNPIGSSPGVDVEGKINGMPATGVGQTLTAAAGDPAAGLRLKITGSGTGARGTVTYSKGYAAQYDQLMTTLLGENGPLASRTAGINASIKSLGKNREAVTLRLQQTEKRFRAEFTALDTALSKMTSTSNYLAQQLSQIAAMSSSR